MDSTDLSWSRLKNMNLGCAVIYLGETGSGDLVYLVGNFLGIMGMEHEGNHNLRSLQHKYYHDRETVGGIFMVMQ